MFFCNCFVDGTERLRDRNGGYRGETSDRSSGAPEGDWCHRARHGRIVLDAGGRQIHVDGVGVISHALARECSCIVLTRIF